VAWPWRLIPSLTVVLPGATPVHPGTAILGSVAVEALVGPLVLQVTLTAVGVLQGSTRVHGETGIITRRQFNRAMQRLVG